MDLPLGLSVQISTLFVSLVISSSTLFAKVPYTQPVVSAFASACARLNLSVACVTLQHFQWYSPILTTPEFEHIAVGHPDSSLSTLPACSHQCFSNRHVGRPFGDRAVLLTCCHTFHRLTRGSSHDLVDYKCHAISHVAHVFAQTWHGTVVMMFI